MQNLTDEFQLTRSEVEVHFGYPTRRALELFATNGGGPTYCKVGRKVLYSAGDIRAWLASHRQQSTSEAA